MKTRTKTLAGSAFAGALVLTLGLGTPALAAPPIQIQDGLVNVAVGDVTVLQDVNVGVAALVAAEVCGLKVGPVAALGRAVDRSGDTMTVCESDQGPVEISQN